MKILIPSAKEMSTNLEVGSSKRFLTEKSKAIVKILSHFNVTELMQMYQIKEDLALREYERLQHLNNGTAAYYPAIALFNGLMYRSMQREQWNECINDYVNQHVAITSALFGVIAADELIAAYRLDFQNHLKINGKVLKNYWQEDYNSSVCSEDVIISLLSSEFEQVFSKSVRERFIKITFMEKGKVHSTISKKARGRFLYEMALQQVTTLNQLRALTFEKYALQADLSQDKYLVFAR